MNTSKLATLANLPIPSDQLNKFDSQLSETVKFIDHLSEVDSKNIPATSQVTGKVNAFRDDKITPGLTQKQALQNASKTNKGYFVVEKVVWE